MVRHTKEKLEVVQFLEHLLDGFSQLALGIGDLVVTLANFLPFLLQTTY